jgi:hypothetical protein
MIKDKRTAEEWGRVAVSLPGWRWMPGMLQWRTGPWMGSRRSVDSDYCDTGHEARVMGGDTWPDPDDPATAGCLLALLGALGPIMDGLSLAGRMDVWSRLMRALMHDPKDIGRACIAAAAALGRWPGGEG